MNRPVRLPIDLPDRRFVASFDIDAQCGFTPLCPSELPVPEGDTIVDALNEQARFASVRVGSKDAHSASAVWLASKAQPQFSPIRGAGANVDIRWNAHCIVGTLGFELLPGLPAVTDYDYFVWKGVEPDMHPYGACFHDLDCRMSTGVIEYLKARGITTVICGGLALDFCVKTTAVQLARAGFNVVVNLMAVAGISNDGCADAIDEMLEHNILIVTLRTPAQMEGR